MGANSGLDGGGFITFGQLLTRADAGYAAYQNAAAGTTGCLYMAALAQALQNANEDLSFIQQAVPAGI